MLGHGQYLEEGGGVEIFHLTNRRHVLEHWDALQVLDAVGQPYGQFATEEGGHLEEN